MQGDGPFALGRVGDLVHADGVVEVAHFACLDSENLLDLERLVFVSLLRPVVLGLFDLALDAAHVALIGKLRHTV